MSSPKPALEANLNFTAGIAVRVVESETEFAALAGEWDELLAQSSANTVFLTWEWLYSWWRHFGAEGKLKLLIAREGKQLLGIAPLCILPERVQGVLPLRVLQFLGTGAVGSDYLDIFAARGREAEVEAALFAELARTAREWDLARLSEMPEESQTCLGLRARFTASREFTYLAGREYLCPFIDIKDKDWAAFEETLSSNMRYNLRRRSKQVFSQLQGVVSRCQRAVDVGGFLDEIFELHARRWRTRGGSDGFESAQVRAFHAEAAARLYARGWLKLYLLEIEHRAVAGIYGIEYGGTFSFYQSGFDPEWDKYSVGMVLMGQTVKDAIESKLAVYDFLHGTEEYKFKWTQTVRRTCSLQAFPRQRIMPRIYFLLRDLKQGIDRLGNGAKGLRG